MRTPFYIATFKKDLPKKVEDRRKFWGAVELMEVNAAFEMSVSWSLGGVGVVEGVLGRTGFGLRTQF